MKSIARPAPAGTFNATPADIEDLIGRTPDPVAALGAQIAQVDVLAGIDLNNVITLPATLTAAKARAFDAKPVPPTTERAAVPAPYANRLEAALDHARRGFDVFPCRSNTKHPHIKGWPDLASRDEAQIRKWWNIWPNANIGAVTTNLLVVDVDTKSGGPLSLLELKKANEFPTTLMNRTGSGGDHIIYSLPTLPEDVYIPNTESEIAAGIDIKSDRGFILLPGSTFNDRPYKWSKDYPVTEAPRWLVDRCTKPRIKPSASAGKRVAEEDDWAREAAWEVVKTSPLVPEGMRNSSCLCVANRMFDFGVELPTAIDYALEWSSHVCIPPMDPEEVRDTVASAMRTRKKAIGCSHPLASGFDAVDIGESAPVEAKPPSFVEIAPPLEPFDPADLPDIPWVIENFVARRSHVILVGPGGASGLTLTFPSLV